MSYPTLLSAVLLAVASGVGAADESVMMGRFSAGEMTDWQTKVFKGETRYGIDDKSGRRALFAESQGAASGLYREIRVDL